MHLWYEPELSWFPSTHHRVALAWARLTVREHADIVALERVLQHLQSNVLIDAALTREIRVTRLDHNKYVILVHDMTQKRLSHDLWSEVRHSFDTSLHKFLARTRISYVSQELAWIS